jgi:hypothetical protein
MDRMHGSITTINFADRLLTAGEDGSVHMIDAETGKALWRLIGHEDSGMSFISLFHSYPQKPICLMVC